MLATSWTPGDPQYQHRGGAEGRKSQARERVEYRPGKRGLEVKALLETGRTDPPLLSREGQRGSNVHSAIWSLYVVPSGHFSVPGPRLGQVLFPLPFRRGQCLQEVEGTLRKGGAQPQWEIGVGGDRNGRRGGLRGIPVQLRGLCVWADSISCIDS